MTIIGQKRVIGDTVAFSGTISGVALAGATARFRAWVGDPDTPTWATTKTLGTSEGSTLDTSTGAWTATIQPADWALLANRPAQVQVELEVVTAAGAVHTVVTGEHFRVTPQANKPLAVP